MSSRDSPAFRISRSGIPRLRKTEEKLFSIIVLILRFQLELIGIGLFPFFYIRDTQRREFMNNVLDLIQLALGAQAQEILALEQSFQVSPCCRSLPDGLC